MKKLVLIFSILIIAKVNSNAQTAVAIFKPLYGGDEHYCRSSANSMVQAEAKALEGLSAVVLQKVGSNANGQQFVYKSTWRKGYFAIGRGKDQYGHYWHYEAVLGYDDSDAAEQAVKEALQGRGLYDIEVFESGQDN